MNPNSDACWESRGYDECPDDWEDQMEEDELTLAELDNRANQFNPDRCKHSHGLR